MIEYKAIYMHGLKQFEDEINKLSKEGWIVKFSNFTAGERTQMGTNKTPFVAFYALLERENK